MKMFEEEKKAKEDRVRQYEENLHHMWDLEDPEYETKRIYEHRQKLDAILTVGKEVAAPYGSSPTLRFLEYPELRKYVLESTCSQPEKNCSWLARPVIENEEAYWNEHNPVFYHGFPVCEMLFQNAMRFIYEAKFQKKLRQDFILLRSSDNVPSSWTTIDFFHSATNERLEQYLNKGMDNSLEKVLLKAHLTLYGNTQYHVEENPFTIFSGYTDGITDEEELEKIIENCINALKKTHVLPDGTQKKIRDIFVAANIAAANKAGELVQIFIPMDLADKIVYLIDPQSESGNPPQQMDFFSNMSDKFMETESGIDNNEVRIFITGEFMLNPDSGIKIYRFIDVYNNVLNKAIEEFAELLSQLKMIPRDPSVGLSDKSRVRFGPIKDGYEQLSCNDENNIVLKKKGLRLDKIIEGVLLSMERYDSSIGKYYNEAKNLPTLAKEIGTGTKMFVKYLELFDWLKSIGKLVDDLNTSPCAKINYDDKNGSFNLHLLSGIVNVRMTDNSYILTSGENEISIQKNGDQFDAVAKGRITGQEFVSMITEILCKFSYALQLSRDYLFQSLQAYIDRINIGDDYSGPSVDVAKDENSKLVITVSSAGNQTSKFTTSVIEITLDPPYSIELLRKHFGHSTRIESEIVVPVQSDTTESSSTISNWGEFLETGTDVRFKELAPVEQGGGGGFTFGDSEEEELPAFYGNLSAESKKLFDKISKNFQKLSKNAKNTAFLTTMGTNLEAIVSRVFKQIEDLRKSMDDLTDRSTRIVNEKGQPETEIFGRYRKALDFIQSFREDLGDTKSTHCNSIAEIEDALLVEIGAKHIPVKIIGNTYSFNHFYGDFVIKVGTDGNVTSSGVAMDKEDFIKIFVAVLCNVRHAQYLIRSYLLSALEIYFAQNDDNIKNVQPSVKIDSIQNGFKIVVSSTEAKDVAFMFGEKKGFIPTSGYIRLLKAHFRGKDPETLTTSDFEVKTNLNERTGVSESETFEFEKKKRSKQFVSFNFDPKLFKNNEPAPVLVTDPKVETAPLEKKKKKIYLPANQVDIPGQPVTPAPPVIVIGTTYQFPNIKELTKNVVYAMFNAMDDTQQENFKTRLAKNYFDLEMAIKNLFWVVDELEKKLSEWKKKKDAPQYNQSFIRYYLKDVYETIVRLYTTHRESTTEEIRYKITRVLNYESFFAYELTFTVETKDYGIMVKRHKDSLFDITLHVKSEKGEWIDTNNLKLNEYVEDKRITLHFNALWKLRTFDLNVLLLYLKCAIYYHALKCYLNATDDKSLRIKWSYGEYVLYVLARNRHLVTNISIANSVVIEQSEEDQYSLWADFIDIVNSWIGFARDGKQTIPDSWKPNLASPVVQNDVEQNKEVQVPVVGEKKEVR